MRVLVPLDLTTPVPLPLLVIRVLVPPEDNVDLVLLPSVLVKVLPSVVLDLRDNEELLFVVIDLPLFITVLPKTSLLPKLDARVAPK